MSTMQNMTQQSLASYSATWSMLLQELVGYNNKTMLAATPPPGTVHIPKAAAFEFKVQGVEIEGEDSLGVDVQFPWEASPIRNHKATLAVGPFYMDRVPVTNSNYSAYLAATGYQPTDRINWLKNWDANSTGWGVGAALPLAVRSPPAALADMPVTWVGFAEAKAYCRWVHGGNGRLPHSYEWQYAAQGLDKRKYPWGNTKDQSKFPTPQSTSKFKGPESVAAYPSGASPFGVRQVIYTPCCTLLGAFYSPV